MLIDRDRGIGKKNDEVFVCRIKDGRIIDVGKVQIVKFEEGKMAARIIDEEPGFNIEIGDFVLKKNLDIADISGFSIGKRVGEERVKELPEKLKIQATPVEKVVVRQDTIEAPITKSLENREVSDTLVVKVPEEREAPEINVVRPPEMQKAPRAMKRTDWVGVHVGVFLPTSGLEHRFENSYSLGITLKPVRAGSHSFGLEATYPFLKTKIPSLTDTRSTLLLVHLVDHIRTGGLIHLVCFKDEG